MGNFLGHLFPGSVFLIISLLWTHGIVRRMVMCRDKKRTFYNTVTYPLPAPRRCFQWPLEAGFKVLLTTIGMIAESISSTHHEIGHKGPFYEHVNMYGFFWVSGVVDLLTRYKKIPKGVDHLALALAFLSESLMFMQHSDHANPLHGHVHILLKYSVFACVVVCLVELAVRNSHLMALTRAFVVCVHGTWFITVGAILYPFLGLPKWDPEYDENLMIASMIFTWNFLLVAVLMALVSLVTYRVNTKHCRPTAEEYKYEVLTSETLSEEESSNDKTKEQEEKE